MQEGATKHDGRKHNAPKARSSTGGTKVFLGACLLGLLLVAVVAALVIHSCSPGTHGDAGGQDSAEGEISNNEYEVVHQQYDAATSDAVPSVEELSNDLSNRGFDDITIEATFDLSGEYLGVSELDSSSPERYPLYQMVYEDANGNWWVIYVCDGQYEANPLFAREALGVVILTEGEYLMSYDGDTNMFISSSPINEGVTLKRVERIDADTLSSIKTVKEVDAL